MVLEDGDFLEDNHVDFGEDLGGDRDEDGGHLVYDCLV